MKVLRVACRNLASFAECEVKFSEGPLADAGLFAIVGPTGAGKSTLLDAICLAVYGKTPRFSAKRVDNVVLGHSAEPEARKIRSADVGQLLRKGTLSGGCEVDYVGSDGKSYRATWGLRRAKRSLKLQKVEMAAYELTPEPTPIPCRGKLEVEKKNQELVGLSFDQFCRSVLLAQGDFARFLRAPESERAEMLEAMTGTSLYRRISRLAFERDAAAKRQLAELEAALGYDVPLPPEERQALEESFQGLLAEQENARGQLEVLRGAHQNFQEQDRLRGSLVRLRQEEATLSQASQALEASARSGEQGVRLWREGGALARAKEREAQGRELQRKLGDAWFEGEEAASLVAITNQEVARAETSLDQWRRAHSEQEGDRQRAHELDERLRTLLEKQKAHGAQLSKQQALVQDAERQGQKLQGQKLAWEEQVAEVRQWLEQKPQEQKLAAAFDVIQHQLLQHESLAEQWAKARTQRECAKQALQQAQALAEGASSAVRGRQAAQAAAVVQLQQATGHLRELEASLGDQGGPGLDRWWARAEGLWLQSDQCARLWQQRKRAHDIAHKGWQAKEQALPKLQSLHEAAEGQLLKAQAEAEAAEELRASAARVMSYAEARGLLEKGKPCPVCGSEEHPYAESHPLSQTLSQLEEDARESQSAAQQAKRAQVDAAGELKHAKTAAEQALGRVATEKEGLAEALSEAQGALGQLQEHLRGMFQGALELKPVPTHPEQWPTFWDTQVTALEQAREEQLAMLRKLEQSHAGVREADKALGASQAALSQSQLELERALSGQKQCQVEFQRLEAEEQRLQGERAELVSGLLPLVRPLGLGPKLEAGEPLLAEVTAIAEGISTRQQALEETQAQLTALQAPLATSDERLSQLGATLKSLLAQSEEFVTEIATLRGERQGLLGGCSLADVKLAYESQLGRRQGALGELRQRAEKQQMRLTALEHECSSLQQASSQRRKDLKEAQAAQASLLKELGLELSEAELALATPLQEHQRAMERWQSHQQALADLNSRVKQGESRLSELAEALKQLPSHEELQAKLTQAEAEFSSQEQALGAIRQRLGDDDKRLQRAKEGQEQLRAERKKAQVWAELGELIGMKNGDKFARFAQGISLEILVGYANEHLRELAPRYRLQRVPSHPLALQIIDGHMGDDIRSVQSLSGGESFLFSLALALGLSSLASERAPIGSLFIDEGFGTLDPASFEQVLGVLDSLHASGRQVGVISHVQALAERIDAQVRVAPVQPGLSEVEVVVGGFSLWVIPVSKLKSALAQTPR